RPPAAVRGAAAFGEGDVAQLHATAVEFEVAALQVTAAQLRVDHHVAAQVDPGHRQSRATALDAQGAVADIAVAFDLQVAAEHAAAATETQPVVGQVGIEHGEVGHTRALE